MPSAREINRRIKSVTNTQQITKAMKMVSSVRLRRAQDRALATAPFTDKSKPCCVDWQLPQAVKPVPCLNNGK